MELSEQRFRINKILRTPKSDNVDLWLMFHLCPSKEDEIEIEEEDR